jgi:adenine/guanine/hypoxanthine permease
VGFLIMAGAVRDIDWSDFTIAVPAFLTMLLMPFTYSITNGIGAGFIAYCVIKLVRGKGATVPAMMYAAAVAFVIYFVLPLVQRLLAA